MWELHYYCIFFMMYTTDIKFIYISQVLIYGYASKFLNSRNKRKTKGTLKIFRYTTFLEN